MSFDLSNPKLLRVLNAFRAKSRLTLSAIIAAALTTALVSTPAVSQDTVAGIWYDDSGKGAVQLYECGSNICGRIYWLRKPLNRAGRPLRDAYNPVTNRRNRPICGLQVIWGAKPQGDGSWDGGRIYDPKVGRSYDVAIEPMGARRLRITGYLGAKFLGKSFVWRKAPADLAKCQVASLSPGQ